MRTLFSLILLMFISMKVIAQASLDLDAADFQDWGAESMYKEVETEYQNLENLPHIRLQYAEFGLERAEQEGNLTQAAIFAERIAVVYTELGMNEKALEFSRKSLDFARQTPGKRDEIWALYRSAESFSILHNSQQALRDTREALRLSLDRDTLTEVGWSYNQMGEIYRRISNYDSAAYHYQQGLSAFTKAKYLRGIQFVRQNLGMTYAATGDYDRALQEFSTSRSILPSTDVLYDLEQGEAMTTIIQHKHAVDSAIVFGLGMMRMAEEGNFPRWERKFKSKLAGLYRESGDWEKAWAFHLKADSLEEAQAGEQIRLQASVADHQYRLKLLEAESDLASQQSLNLALLWISVVLVFGLLGVVGLIQVNKSKRIRKINAQLSAQNDHLDELVKEKDIWMDLMVHDLKSPLTAISGLLDMLKDSELPQAVREKVLDNIAKSVNKGSTLISQLLEISRLESSEGKADFQLTNLSDLVQETAKTFQPTAESKGISLLVTLPAGSIEVETDPVHAHHIVENFVSNAIKFSPVNKEIQLVLEMGKHSASIHVIDQGPGLSIEDQENMFQKFRRLSARPTGGESSTGLGLSIVKLLADRINGEIQVKSAPGQGATFTLLLPKNQ